MPDKPTAKQDGRQRARDRAGRYEKFQACYGGCGRRLNTNAGAYASHPLTDCTGDDGRPWHDTALVLCDPCAVATQDMRNVGEFLAFKAANIERRTK